MLATTRAPADTNAGSDRSNHAGTPWFCKPTELSMPAAVEWTRGAALPSHGAADNDLTTTAPSDARSKYAPSSAPYPAVPDAVRIGLGRTTVPTRTDRSVK